MIWLGVGQSSGEGYGAVWVSRWLVWGRLRAVCTIPWALGELEVLLGL